MRVIWNTQDDRLNQSLNSSLNNVGDIPYGLIVLTRMSWLIPESKPEDGTIFHHVAEYKEEFTELDVNLLCEETMRAYSVSLIHPLNNSDELDDVFMCRECASQAELKILLSNHIQL